MYACGFVFLSATKSQWCFSPMNTAAGDDFSERHRGRMRQVPNTRATVTKRGNAQLRLTSVNMMVMAHDGNEIASATMGHYMVSIPFMAMHG